VAVISMGDIVTAESIKLAGDSFDFDILQYIKKEYKLVIGVRTAEDIKINVANVYEGSRDEELSIRGRDMVNGLRRTITVNSGEIEKALQESANLFTKANHTIVERMH